MTEAEKQIREALAAGPTPGPWHHDSDPVKNDPLHRVRFRVTAKGRTITETYYSSAQPGAPFTSGEADNRFIAACSPENIAALLAEIDRLTRELDEARAELERERMRLVACGVVAMSNTPESAAKARDMLPDYRSASCDDVARAVDREMALRAEILGLHRALQHESDCVEAAKAGVDQLRAAVGRARDALTLCTVVVGDSDDYDTIVDALRACGNALVAVALAQAKDAEAR